jgi:hypothetical protein
MAGPLEGRYKRLHRRLQQRRTVATAGSRLKYCDLLWGGSPANGPGSNLNPPPIHFHQPSTLIIQTTPNHCMISSQPKSNILTIHGFTPLKPISQSMVFEKTLPRYQTTMPFHTGHKPTENTPYGIKKQRAQACHTICDRFVLSQTESHRQSNIVLPQHDSITGQKHSDMKNYFAFRPMP